MADQNFLLVTGVARADCGSPRSPCLFCCIAAKQELRGLNEGRCRSMNHCHRQKAWAHKEISSRTIGYPAGD